jgi:hypothetical protein
VPIGCARSYRRSSAGAVLTTCGRDAYCWGKCCCSWKATISQHPGLTRKQGYGTGTTAQVYRTAAERLSAITVPSKPGIMFVFTPNALRVAPGSALRPASLLPALSRAFGCPALAVRISPPARACYRALPRLPERISHPLEQRVFQDTPALNYLTR